MLEFGPLWCRQSPISPLSQTQGIFSSLDLLRLWALTRIHLTENYSTGSSSHVSDAAEVPKTVVTDTDWLTCSIFGSRNPHWNIHSWQMTTPLMMWPHASEGPSTNQSPTVISSPCWVMIAQLMDWLCPRRDANGQLYGRQHLEPAVIDSRQRPTIENQILRVKSNVNVNCIGVFRFWNWHWTFSTYIAS